MDVSIIIATWNNTKRLSITLEALRQCRIPVGIFWECIIVNNNSTDDTEKIILSFKDKLPIEYVFEPIQGLSRARNAGLKAATGKLIIFGDDDIEPCKEWLESYWEAYQENSSEYYWGGPIESIYEKGTLDQDLIAIAPESVKGFNLGNKKIMAPKGKFFLAANWACPIEILRILNGFNVDKGLNPSSGRIKTGEETDLMKRLNELGWQGLYIPQALIKHFVPFQKMNMKHIAMRWEAYGFYQTDLYVKYLNNSLLCGIPPWMIKEAFLKWLNYLLKKILGHKWHEDYVAYREYVGILKGLQEIGKANVK